MVERTNLSTPLAHVGLLSGVNTRVDSKSRSLNELLSAAWIVADVRSDAAVDTFWKTSQFSSQLKRVGRIRRTMSCKVTSTRKTFAAS